MRLRSIALVLVFSAMPAALQAQPAANRLAAKSDWPQWRGPNRDGISAEKGLLKSWPKDGPPLAWQGKGLGGGYSSVVVSGGKIFTMGGVRGGESLIAVSAQDGSPLWTLKVSGGGSPNCTPTVDGNLVFGLGHNGDLVCATTDGKEQWRKNFGKDFSGQMMSSWGYSESPLVDGDLLICTPGGRSAVLAALNKRTGKTVWKAVQPGDIGRRGGDGAGYSSVVVSNGAGVKQYIQLVGRGLVSVSAKTGKVLWTYNDVANDTANIPTPLVSGDFVFCSSGYGTGAALLKLAKDGSGVKAEEVYFLKANDMENHHGGMILVGDHVSCGHGHNEGFPLCIELKTGKTAWRPGRGPGGGSAAIAYADGHLYFRYQDGVMALIEANPKEYKLKGSFKLATHNGESWPHPVISGGKLYVRDQDALLCYDIKAK